MSENEFFLKVGANHWINPFSGNIAYAVQTTNFDGESVLDIHFSSGKEIRWGSDSPEAKAFVTWLDDNAVGMEKRNAALNQTRDEMRTMYGLTP